MKNKYPVTRYAGIPLHLDNSGHYYVKVDAKVHYWRNGKHTRGHFEDIGQLFLTENSQLVVIVGAESMNFKDRRQLASLERFTKERINPDLLHKALAIYQNS